MPVRVVLLPKPRIVPAIMSGPEGTDVWTRRRTKTGEPTGENGRVKNHVSGRRHRRGSMIERALPHQVRQLNVS